MRYDFNEHINRYGTSSAKWDMVGDMFGRDDVLPMWVADTDFRVPHEVIDALKERLEHPIFGYTRPSAKLIQVIIDRMKDLYDWDVKPEWIGFTNGIVSGCMMAVRTLADIGDEIIIQNPVYYPFKRTVKLTGTSLLENPLKRVGNTYEMDFEQLESLFKVVPGFGGNVPRIRASILCNPHNPVAKVWTAEELKRYADIIIDNGGIVISDDIHSDLVLSGHKHTMLASLGEKYEQNTITFFAPSKTFNVAGLKSSVVIIPNDKIRERFLLTQSAGYNSPTILGLTALQAAYEHGADYVEEVNAHVESNYNYFKEYCAKHIPELTVMDMEGTYLMWVDFAKLNLGTKELASFMVNDVKVATDYGYAFGEGGETFMRFNLGCTRATVEECLKRLDKAVSEWRAKQ